MTDKVQPEIKTAAVDTNVVVVEMVMVIDMGRRSGGHSGEDDKEGREIGPDCPWTGGIGGRFPLERYTFLGDELHLLEETGLSEENLFSGEFFFFGSWRWVLLVVRVMITIG